MRYLLTCLFFISTNVIGHNLYSEGMLKAKQRFEQLEQAAIAHTFEGLRTSDGKIGGLYKLKRTGVSTQKMQEAAEAYLKTLSTEQQIKSQFAINSEQWRKWSNVDNGIYARLGVSIKSMSDLQRRMAFRLIEESLSAKGFQLTEDIMKTEQALKEINNGAAHIDEDLYFLKILGIPSKSEPWGWQFNGHHLVINYFVLGDQVVMSPSFFGAEPTVVTSGKYAGTSVLQREQDQGLALIRSLPFKLQEMAVIDEVKEGDNMKAAANKDNIIMDFQGLKASTASREFQQQLLSLISLYVSNMKEGHAKIRMEEVESHINDTYFSWVGGTGDDDAFYYRIHSPVILIEFDHQRPVGTRAINKKRVPIKDHIHVVVRTPNGNDYGKDLLRQHIEKHH